MCTKDYFYKTEIWLWSFNADEMVMNLVYLENIILFLF